MQSYDFIGKTSEGLRRAKVGVFTKQKCGFIDENNYTAIPLLYSNVKDFHEGLAAVSIVSWASNKWGYINVKGEIVIPIIYEKPRPFSDGLAKVVFENEWWFIDTNGNKVISLKDYNGGSSFHHGYAIVRKKGSSFLDENFGIIDKSGKEVIPCNVKCHQLKSFFQCNTLEESVKNYTKS